MPDEKLEQAIALSRAGKKLEAREILNNILQANRINETTWLWFADTFMDAPNRIRVLEECIKYIPNSQVAQKWLVTFRAEEEAKKASSAQEHLPDFQKSQMEGDESAQSLISGSNAHQKFDSQLDCSGLDCPLPILKTKKTLDTLQSGQVLKMIATDPSAPADIQAWTSMTGHALIGNEKEGESFIFYIKRK